MLKRRFAQKTVEEFEKAKPANVTFRSMSLSSGYVHQVKGYTIRNGKPGAILIMWDYRGRAYIRDMSLPCRQSRVHNMMIIEGWVYVRNHRFDLIFK